MERPLEDGETLPTDAEPTRAIVEEFDGYRLLESIGRGGMGEVFFAHDTVLDRHVAIKLLAGRTPSPAARARFLREVRAIARLQHPNVVAVHRAGEVHGQPYLVSELVRGKSLDRASLPLAPDELVRVGLGLTAGLAAAHRRGVLHRDLKPGNVLFSEDGEVKLCDFGLAKLIDRTEDDGSDTEDAGTHAGVRLTRPGTLMGTPHYMPPEAWRREPATAQSDLYSLGALLYHCAAGEPPHPETDLTMLGVAVLDGPPPPLARIVPELDARLATLIDRCLATDAAARPASADEVHAELLAIGAGALAVPPGNPYRGLRAFDVEHVALFFGRARETLAVVELLRTQGLVVVAGDSGVGKSSLCRAGVVQRLASGGLRDARTWTTVRFTPGRHPLAAVAGALAAELGPGATGDAEWLAGLREDPLAVARRAGALLGRDRGLVLLCDQLEELVTESDAGERDEAAAALAALGDGLPGLRVLATARGDFLTRLAALPGLARELSRALFLLGPLDATQRREIVVGPARVTGMRFDSEALVETLVTAAGATPTGLPLLQFALAELWERRDAARGVLSAAGLEAIGGVTGALARHADAVLAAMSPGERSHVRRILTQLVGSDGTRRARSETELVGDDTQASAALRALVRGRLVAARGGEHGESIYELAHEALVTGWSRLRDWLDGDAERRQVQERLALAAAEWERLGRAPAAVSPAPQLAEAARVGIAPAALGGRERAFLLASQRALRVRTWRRRALVAALPLVALALWGGVTVSDRRERARAVAGRLAAASPDLAAAEAHAAQAGRLRTDALAAFDRGDARGEDLWQNVLAESDAAEAAYARASQPLETALQLDRGRDDVRAQLAGSLFARARLAETVHARERLAQVLQRLAWHDPDGRWRARWEAPATLVLGTSPAHASVRIMRYETFGTRRVLGAPKDLGFTPLETTLASGSYLLDVSLPGHSPVRYAVRLGRGERFAADVPVPEDVPDGYVFVPPGRFLYGSEAPAEVRNLLVAPPEHALTTAGYLIGRHEVTWGEWLAYVRDAAPAERAARLVATAKVALRDLGNDRYQLHIQPSNIDYEVETGVPLTYRDRRERQRQDWSRLPVTGISTDDANAFTAWLDATGRLPGARLCSDREWERAARGADERLYPHGDELTGADANVDVTYGRLPGGFGPDEVGSHPESDSPFGVADLSGNVWEYVRSDLDPKSYSIRGGSFYQHFLSGLATNREPTEPGLETHVIGMRVCASVEGAKRP